MSGAARFKIAKAFQPRKNKFAQFRHRSINENQENNLKIYPEQEKLRQIIIHGSQNDFDLKEKYKRTLSKTNPKI